MSCPYTPTEANAAVNDAFERYVVKLVILYNKYLIPAIGPCM